MASGTEQKVSPILVSGETIDYSTVPVDYMAEGMRNWIEFGVIGSYSLLECLIRNDLRDAVYKADENNIGKLADWVHWLRSHAPESCWGSREAITHWQELTAPRRKRVFPEGGNDHE